MKQLRPRTILAIGVPGSLLINTCAAGVVLSHSNHLEPQEWKYATAILAISGWLLLNIPIFVGMAWVRRGIGRSTEKYLKLRTAFRYCFIFITLTVVATTGCYLARDHLVFDLPILRSVLFLIAINSVALAVVTCLNMLIRTYTDGWTTNLTQHAKNAG